MVATSSGSTCKLIFFISLGINFTIGFAIEQQLSPTFILLKNVKDISVEVVVSRRWMNKCPIFQTVVLKLLFVSFCDPKSFDAFFVLEFKRCFGSSILNKAKYLDHQFRVLYETPIPAYILVLYLTLAHITFVLDFYKVYFYNKTAYL
jgi:hypothetical protein